MIFDLKCQSFIDWFFEVVESKYFTDPGLSHEEVKGASKKWKTKKWRNKKCWRKQQTRNENNDEKIDLQNRSRKIEIPSNWSKRMTKMYTRKSCFKQRKKQEKI